MENENKSVYKIIIDQIIKHYGFQFGFVQVEEDGKLPIILIGVMEMLKQ